MNDVTQQSFRFQFFTWTYFTAFMSPIVCSGWRFSKFITLSCPSESWALHPSTRWDSACADPCTCNTPRCHCNARFKPDLLCVTGIPYQHQSTAPTSTVTIQFIEFTFCNDQFPLDTIDRKIHKYEPLIQDIQAHGWNVAPPMVLTACAKATSHISHLNHDTPSWSITHSKTAH
jgi:hypothetical protein